MNQWHTKALVHSKRIIKPESKVIQIRVHDSRTRIGELPKKTGIPAFSIEIGVHVKIDVGNRADIPQPAWICWIIDQAKQPMDISSTACSDGIFVGQAQRRP